MYSLWEVSTDSLVTALVVICISALAVAWLFAGRRRPTKEGSLEERRLAGREAEVNAAPMTPPLNEASSVSEKVSEKTLESPADVTEAASPPSTEHHPDEVAPAELPPQFAPDAISDPPAAVDDAPKARSPEQESAMSIAAALVRHDKRDVAPSTAPSQELPLENVSLGGDDLTAIEGIDGKMAKELNDLGIRYFDQLVDWSPEHAIWVSSQLSTPVTNVQRTAWVVAAKEIIEQETLADRKQAERTG